MKKLLVLAMMATLLMAGSAFAVNRHTIPNATFTFGAPGVASGPTTTNNDDSCDIGVAPAATLLLPYFEVDVTNRTQDTLFTITNVTRLPQIAHVTVWTDWSFPVLDFNIYLTGYDVQGISMNQLLGGTIGAATGTGPTQAVSPLGALSSGFTNNPNFAAGGPGCATQPGALNATIVADLRAVLTTGRFVSPTLNCGSSFVGGTHPNAIGYVTIDVNAACNTFLPIDPLYYQTQMLFDNVLIGDYQQLGPTATGAAPSFDAGGNAMVHIRAIPEGGPAGTPLTGAQTNLPYTFYDRYTPATNRTLDRRQPLPALWAARYIQGGPGAFATNYKVWREGFGAGSCGASLALNGSLPVAEVVRFDEHENPNTSAPCPQSPCPQATPSIMPETSAQNTSSGNFPVISSADVGGWMYLNLNNGGSTGYSVTRNVGGVPTIITGAGSTSNLAPAGSATVGPRPSQNWVVIEMFGSAAGGNRLTVDFDAAWLGNGCSPAVGPGAVIAPAGGVLVCPPLDPGCTPGVAPYTGTNTTPLP
jgi:hypothetical protein